MVPIMTVTIRELARICGAEPLGGKPDSPIDSAANLDEAQAGQITFIGSARYLAKLKTTSAGAVIVPRGTSRDGVSEETCLLAVDDPEMAFVACLNHLYPVKPNPGTVSSMAQIDPTVSVGAGTFIDAFVRIGAHVKVGRNCQLHAGCRIDEGVTIGDSCVLYPNVVLYRDVKLGNNVVIHAGAVIGADGFGYKFRNGEHVKFPQVGIVVIESDVEIGANTCIDRAALGETRIGKGTKIDNLVQIAHNVHIGSHSLLCGQVGIGGSTEIGNYVTLAAQSGVADHLKVGDQALVYAQAGVTKETDAKEQVMGYPATRRRDFLHETAALRRLASEQKAINELVRLLPKLRGPSSGGDE
jgi:UDP-3-O-[3-hydroxymyristoyl] glucosamine N-acyltransferase